MSRIRHKSSPFSLFSFQDIITCTTAVIILLTLILVLELVTREPAKAHDASVEVDLHGRLSKAQKEFANLHEEITTQHQIVNELAGAPPERMAQDIDHMREQIEHVEAELPELESAVQAHAQARMSAESELSGRTEDQDRLRTVLAEAKRAREQSEQLKNENRVVFNASGTSSKRAWLVEISDRQIAVRPLGHKQDSVQFASAWRSAAAQFTEWLSKHGPATNSFVLLVRPTGVAAFHELEEGLKSRSYAYGFDLVGETQLVEISSPKSGETP